MSRKHIISKHFIGTDDAPQAVSADYTSETLNVRQTDNGSIHLSWSGGSSPNMTVQVQARNGDAKQDDWRTLDFGSPITISGASGEHEIILTTMPFADLQIFIDVTSGSANVDGVFTLKSVGA